MTFSLLRKKLLSDGAVEAPGWTEVMKLVFSLFFPRCVETTGRQPTEPI